MAPAIVKQRARLILTLAIIATELSTGQAVIITHDPVTFRWWRNSARRVLRSRFRHLTGSIGMSAGGGPGGVYDGPGC